MKKTILTSLLWASACLLPAHAVIFDFIQVTDNGEALIADQLVMEVTDPGSDQVLFTFSNTGPIQSAISSIFFDDVPATPLLASIAEIQDNPWTGGNPQPSTPNVSFSEAAGGNLGAGVTDFVDTFHFTADAPPAKTGIDPGESLGLLFNLSFGFTYQNVLESLFANGPHDLRVGLHVISIAGLGSEKYLNTGGTPDDIPNPTPPIPEPATGLLMAMGLFGVAARRFRK